MPDGHSPPATARPSILARTAAALGVARMRRDTKAVFVGTGVSYLLVYLVTVGDLGVFDGGTGPFTVRVASDLSRAVASVGFFRFDAIALVSAGGVTYLFLPLNLLVASLLAGLVGANGALTYLGLVQPRACGIEASAGVRSGIPALLSGAACCGPTILLVVGVQASATLIPASRCSSPSPS